MCIDISESISVACPEKWEYGQLLKISGCVREISDKFSQYDCLEGGCLIGQKEEEDEGVDELVCIQGRRYLRFYCC